LRCRLIGTEVTGGTQHRRCRWVLLQHSTFCNCRQRYDVNIHKSSTSSVFLAACGLIAGTIGNEVTENDELIRQDLSLIFEVIRNKLAAFFIRENVKGALLPGVKEEALADFCIATIQGAMLMGKIKRNSQSVETAIREALSHLRGFCSGGN
jgi:Tetracyclin repressor-like, C-terminal domain